jgi:hypothetical protein
MAEPIVTPRFLAVVVAGLATLSAIAFGVLAAWAIVDVWQAKVEPQPTEAFTYIETGLAGLVGGIVAAAFGVSVPTEKVAGLSNLSTAGASERQWIGGAYVMIYLLVGLAAAATWLVNSDVTSTVVKNLGSTFVGMVIPIVAGYFAKNE